MFDRRMERHLVFAHHPYCVQLSGGVFSSPVALFRHLCGQTLATSQAMLETFRLSFSSRWRFAQAAHRCTGAREQKRPSPPAGPVG